MEICDFCSGTPVVVGYRCRSFEHDTIRGIHIMSQGAWAACPTCRDYIESQQWSELIIHSVNCFIENNPILAGIMGEELLLAHQWTIVKQFWENRL